jgi:hypothetical protein
VSRTSNSFVDEPVPGSCFTDDLRVGADPVAPAVRMGTQTGRGAPGLRPVSDTPSTMPGYSPRSSMDGATLQVQGRSIARALRAIAGHSAQSFSMQSKPGRFRIQKTVYLLKRMGYPAAKKYEFNIYLNGPYSPDLAATYYALGDEGLRAGTAAPDVGQARLETVTEALQGSDDFLEGLTTVVDGIVTFHHRPRALAWAKSIKPHLAEPVWQEVRRFLLKHQELTRST